MRMQGVNDETSLCVKKMHHCETVEVSNGYFADRFFAKYLINLPHVKRNCDSSVCAYLFASSGSSYEFCASLETELS